MAKVTGLGASIAVDNSSGVAKTISNSVTNYQFSTPKAVTEVTGVDKSAIERLLLLVDFSVQFNGEVDTTADMAHDVFSSVPTTAVARTTVITAATKVMTAECLYTDYQISRGDSGDLTWQAPGVLSDGTAPAWT